MKVAFGVYAIVFLWSDNVYFVRTSRNFPCTEPVAIGFCIKYTKRWAWKSGKCRQFDYSGCGGNNNNFFNQQDCMAQCKHMVHTTNNLLQILQDLKEQRQSRGKKPVTLTKLHSQVHELIAPALIPRRTRALRYSPKHHNYKWSEESPSSPPENHLTTAFKSKEERISQNGDRKVDHYGRPKRNTMYLGNPKPKKNKKISDRRTDKNIKNHKADDTRKEVKKPIFVRSSNSNELPLRHLLMTLWPDVLFSKKKYLVDKGKITQDNKTTKDVQQRTLEDIKDVIHNLKLAFKDSVGKSSKRQKRIKLFNLENSKANKQTVIGKVYRNVLQGLRNRLHNSLLQLKQNIYSLINEKLYIRKDEGTLGISAEDYEKEFDEDTNRYPIRVKRQENNSADSDESEVSDSLEEVVDTALRMIIRKGINRVPKEKRVLNFNDKLLLTDLNNLQRKMYKPIRNRRVYEA